MGTNPDGHKATLEHPVQGEQGRVIPHCYVDPIGGLGLGRCCFRVKEGEEEHICSGEKGKPSHVLKRGSFEMIERYPSYVIE